MSATALASGYLRSLYADQVAENLTSLPFDAWATKYRRWKELTDQAPNTREERFEIQDLEGALGI